MTNLQNEPFQDVIPRFWREGFVRDIHYHIKKSERSDVLLNCTATVDPLEEGSA